MNNIKVIPFESWVDFQKYIVDEKINLLNNIYRGQRDENWLLEPKIFRKKNLKIDYRVLGNHLENFKYAIRGRRGVNPPELKTENDWWALGQHYGLDTPLLDWTTSPFVAAYFAFYEEDFMDSKNEFRVVYALNKFEVERKNKDIEQIRKKIPFAPFKLEVFSPLTDENPRLVNQGGLFTRIGYENIEKWIEEQFKNESTIVLYKFKIPENQRDIILKVLNKMNINHLSLFPDITGASIYSNMTLSIDNY